MDTLDGRCETLPVAAPPWTNSAKRRLFDGVVFHDPIAMSVHSPEGVSTVWTPLMAGVRLCQSPPRRGRTPPRAGCLKGVAFHDPHAMPSPEMLTSYASRVAGYGVVFCHPMTSRSSNRRSSIICSDGIIFVLSEGTHTVSILFSGSNIFACTAIIALAKPLTAVLSIAMIFFCSPEGVHSMDNPFRRH